MNVILKKGMLTNKTFFLYIEEMKKECISFSLHYEEMLLREFVLSLH